jgi:hypothetical protein
MYNIVAAALIDRLMDLGEAIVIQESSHPMKEQGSHSTSA